MAADEGQPLFGVPGEFLGGALEGARLAAHEHHNTVCLRRHEAQQEDVLDAAAVALECCVRHNSTGV